MQSATGARSRGLVSALPSAQRRWIVINALVLTALANALVNAIVAWLAVRDLDRVPLVSIGQPSTMLDTLGTLFILPLLTCIIFTGAIWRQTRSGRLPHLPELVRDVPVLVRVPVSKFRRGLLFGGLVFTTLAVPTAALLIAVGPLAAGEFLAFKVLFAVMLGAVVTPVIAICALADPPGW